MKINKKTHHILIIDDDPVIQVFLKEYFSHQGYKTSFSNSGENLKLILNSCSVSLIILDVVLPGKDGIYWLGWLNCNYPEIKVMMLSVKGEDDDRIKCLESGAHDYLVKPFNSRELLARINNLLRESSAQINLIEFGEFVFDIDRLCLTKDKQVIKLTNTELIFLKCLCDKSEQIVSRDDLSQALRGDTHNPLDRSIDVHINRLRGKIEDDPSAPQFIRTVWGKGYQFSTLE
jgi:DNA-binding response OmpR family regulator